MSRINLRELERKLEELEEYEIYEEAEWDDTLRDDIGKEIKHILKKELGLDCLVYVLQDELDLPDYLAVCQGGKIRIGINVKYPEEDDPQVYITHAFIANNIIKNPGPYYRLVGTRFLDIELT
jgi:hypothetical protein